MKMVGKCKIDKCKNKINIDELLDSLQSIVKSTDAYNKKTVSVFDYYYDNLHEDLEYINVNADDDKDKVYSFLTYLGQKSLNIGCDIMIYENNVYLVESHHGNDFLLDGYFEVCDYCYDVKLITKIEG